LFALVFLAFIFIAIAAVAPNSIRTELMEKLK
jgi:hypothetical protein